MLAIILLMLITYTGLIPLTSAQMEEAKLKLDLEPRDCGRVYAEPSGENYTYRAGTMVQIYAEQAAGCRFAYWVSDLGGLNGSLNNPVTLTLFSDAYFKAVFVRVGEAKPGGEVVGGRTHAFLKVTANVSRFQEDVKLVPVGEEVAVTAPRDIYINDTARYVFVGWEGYDSREPILKVLVKEDTTVKALYTLYMRFMELWYHYSDFTVFYTPIVDLSPGERLKPVHLTIKPMNITLPVGSKIPREFLDRVEVGYQKEYLLVVRSTAPEIVPVMINGEYCSLGSSVERWIPEGLKADIIVLVEETERGWISEPRRTSFIMDGPRSIVIGYEEKPYSWALESPLKPIIYPLLEYVADSYKGTGMWPQLSQLVSQPMLVYSILLALPAGLGGIGYLGYRVLSRMETGGKTGSARRIIEERIRKASPEEIISAISSGTQPTSSMSREEMRLPENIPFPDWLYLEATENIEEYKPMKLEEVESIKEVEVGKKLEEVRKLDLMEVLSAGGEVEADELVEALMESLDGEVLERLRGAVLSGKLKITAVRNAVWSPVKVRAVFRELDKRGSIALVGADQYVRRKVAEWAGLIEQEVTGKPYILVENASERDADSAAAKIGDACLVILGETVRPDVARVYGYAARLLGRKIVKLGDGPLPAVKLESPSRRELAAYMVVKAAVSGLIGRIGMKDVIEVSRIAIRSRGYDTIDYYLELLSGKPVDLESFRKMESSKLFDEHERVALEEWRRAGDVNAAITHYSNLLAQMDRVDAETKLRIFKEKLLKLSGGLEDKEDFEDRVAKMLDSDLKSRVAEKMIKNIENIKNEEVRKRLAKYFETSRRRSREE